MDKIIGRYGGDEKNRMTTQNRQQSTAKKTPKNLKGSLCNYVAQSAPIIRYINGLRKLKFYVSATLINMYRSCPDVLLNVNKNREPFCKR